jgi:hypothetical protein
VAHESKREWGGARVLNFLIIFGGGGFLPAKQKNAEQKLSFGGERWANENYMIFLAVIGWPANIIRYS